MILLYILCGQTNGHLVLILVEKQETICINKKFHCTTIRHITFSVQKEDFAISISLDDSGSCVIGSWNPHKKSFSIRNNLHNPNYKQIQPIFVDSTHCFMALATDQIVELYQLFYVKNKKEHTATLNKPMEVKEIVPTMCIGKGINSRDQSIIEFIVCWNNVVLLIEIQNHNSKYDIQIAAHLILPEKIVIVGYWIDGYAIAISEQKKAYIMNSQHFTKKLLQTL